LAVICDISRKLVGFIEEETKSIMNAVVDKTKKSKELLDRYREVATEELHIDGDILFETKQIIDKSKGILTEEQLTSIREITDNSIKAVDDWNTNLTSKPSEFYHETFEFQSNKQTIKDTNELLSKVLCKSRRRYEIFKLTEQL
jgi:hypothetical protein